MQQGPSKRRFLSATVTSRKEEILETNSIPYNTKTYKYDMINLLTAVG